MRRLAYLAVCGAMLAGPAWSSEAGDMLATLRPECAKPVAALSVAEIDECRTFLRMLGHFIDAKDRALDARGLKVVPSGK
jgi:hypothetical protein